MLPAAISGILASFDAISRTFASRLRPDATSSRRSRTGPCERVRQGIRGHRGTGGRLSDQPPSSSRTIRVPSTIALSFAKATSRCRRTRPQSGAMASRPGGNVQRRPDPVGDDGRRLDFVGLDVDDAEPDCERRIEVLEEADVVFAAAGELHRQLVDPRVDDRREEEAVAALERGLAVAIAVADVRASAALRRRRPCALIALQRPRQILGEAGVVRLVDLDARWRRHAPALAARGSAPGASRARTPPRSVVLVLDALDQRGGPVTEIFDALLGEAAQEPRLLGQPQRARSPASTGPRCRRSRSRSASSRDRPARRHPLGEVVDHVVALRLAVGDDVDPGVSWSLIAALRTASCISSRSRRLSRRRQVVVLRALEPLGHRVAADHGGRKQRSGPGFDIWWSLPRIRRRRPGQV